MSNRDWVYSSCEVLRGIAEGYPNLSVEREAIRNGAIALQFSAVRHYEAFDEYRRLFDAPLTATQIEGLRKRGIDPDETPRANRD